MLCIVDSGWSAWVVRVGIPQRSLSPIQGRACRPSGYFETIFPWDHFNHTNINNFNLKCLNVKIFTQKDFFIPERRFFNTRFKIFIAPPF